MGVICRSSGFFLAICVLHLQLFRQTIALPLIHGKFDYGTFAFGAVGNIDHVLRHRIGGSKAFRTWASNWPRSLDELEENE